jgi:hypothetical protein
MLKRQQRLLLSTILFIAVVLIFTRIDYLIHSELYESGLVYNDSWFWTSQILYFAMYQAAIIMLYLYSRSKRLLIIFEAFVLTGGQDFVFFGIWNAGVFPDPSLIWTWTVAYHLFGFPWNTWFNLWLTSVATGAAVFVAKVYNPDR